MDAINLTLLAILASIFAYLIRQAWKANQFWKERGVPYVKPWLFIGNTLPQITGKMAIGELHQSLFEQLPNESVIGIYDFMKPVLFIKDVDIVEKVIIKDFNHFTNHGFEVDEQRNPLDANLFAMTGKRWKAVRSKLSPIFTSGKLKSMYQSMADCGDLLVEQMAKEGTEDVDMRDIIGRFAMDTMGSSVFGIDSGNLVKPDNEFRRMGKKALKVDIFVFMKLVLLVHFPAVVKFFNITFSKPEVVNYFSKIIKDTLKHRRENGFRRNDFIQMLMQLQDKGYVEMHTKDPQDDYLNIEPTYTSEKFELSDDQLTGHAVGFLTAGFETTAISMVFTLYELSKNSAIQERVREEILREVEHAGGSLSYDALKEMTYLEQCVKETLRKYPPAQVLMRLCNKEYTFPNGLTIQPGQSVMFPITVIHHDPRNFPEPEKFKPERFDPDQTIPTCAYIPFGNGPRICIAMRFAILEIKYCLAKLLMNYSFTLSTKTKQPLEIEARNFLTMPKHTLYFNLKKIANNNCK